MAFFLKFLFTKNWVNDICYLCILLRFYLYFIFFRVVFLNSFIFFLLIFQHLCILFKLLNSLLIFSLFSFYFAFSLFIIRFWRTPACPNFEYRIVQSLPILYFIDLCLFYCCNWSEIRISCRKLFPNFFIIHFLIFFSKKLVRRCQILQRTHTRTSLLCFLCFIVQSFAFESLFLLNRIQRI